MRRSTNLDEQVLLAAGGALRIVRRSGQSHITIEDHDVLPLREEILQRALNAFASISFKATTMGHSYGPSCTHGQVANRD
jgi:hypothetical protein